MNFDDVLNTPAAEIVKPPVVPTGTYIWKIARAYKESTQSQGAWRVVEFPIVAVSPDTSADDIDLDALEEYGSLNSANASIKFMFPTDADKKIEVQRTAAAMKKFLLDVLRVDAEDGATMKELMAKAPGYEFRGQAAHREYNGDTFLDVKNYMPLE